LRRHAGPRAFPSTHAGPPVRESAVAGARIIPVLSPTSTKERSQPVFEEGPDPGTRTAAPRHLLLLAARRRRLPYVTLAQKPWGCPVQFFAQKCMGSAPVRTGFSDWQAAEADPLPARLLSQHRPEALIGQARGHTCRSRPRNPGMIIAPAHASPALIRDVASHFRRKVL
jgi:hypothetical protein